jgi:hypothetical protein
VPEPRAQVRNAGDAKQVQHAARVEKRRAELFGGALRSVMSSPAGRLVFWELLRRAGVYRSIWDNSARIHYNAGRQDFGHEIMAELLASGEDLYLVMETEARALVRRENAETEAVHATATETTT